MKNVTFFLSIICFSILISCQKNDLPDEIVCEGECLFTLTEVSGTMIMMGCFSKFGIKIQNPNPSESNFNFIIPDALDGKYEVSDKEVTITAICRANTLEPALPDPGFDMNSIFQAEIISIEEKE